MIDELKITKYIDGLTEEQKDKILFELILNMHEYEEVNIDDEGELYNRHSGDRYSEL